MFYYGIYISINGIVALYLLKTQMTRVQFPVDAISFLLIE